MIYKTQFIDLSINGVRIKIILDISKVQQIIPFDIIADSVGLFKVTRIDYTVEGSVTT